MAHRRKHTKNPARFLSDKQLGKLAGDMAIQSMFGLFGTALAASSPKLKEAMLNIATKGGIEISPGIVVARTADERTSDPDPQPTSIQTQKENA